MFVASSQDDPGVVGGEGVEGVAQGFEQVDIGARQVVDEALESGIVTELVS